MTTAVSVNWQDETKHYDRPHPRLELIASLLARLPQRRLLDVGCSTGTLRTLLPTDFEYYGCDIADHARHNLEADHFCVIDFNKSCDLSVFSGRGINVIHIGGVLEYLERPGELLRALRGLIVPGTPMLLSFINFESRKFANRAAHHRGWVYKPSAGELRDMLQREGWNIKRQLPFFGKRGPRGLLYSCISGVVTADHSWIRRHARQFILMTHAA